MIEYIKGQIIELKPTEVVIECNNIAYQAQISVQTFSALEGMSDAKIYLHHILREDEELDYGFASKNEREFFRLLLGVSGVGASTARMMLSSLSTEEIRNAIIGEDVNKIKSIKGIGLKTAQRLILELKDKVVKGEGSADVSALFQVPDSGLVQEATTALVLLGFAKANVTKVVSSIIKEQPTATIETIIKLALKKL